ncbi:MAG: GNAT family N-acetyltransferase [Candidatus Dormibacteraeota bacterium]|nr:GNAT family N-acetyltransferase [Candidatus Dormibacteraeota bacterium]
MDSGEVMLRPVRPADRERIEAICEKVWEGRDHVPHQLDSWLADPAATFQAAERNGEVAGIQRLLPVAPGIVLYHALRVAPEYRRQGVARSMLRQALMEAGRLGFSEVRLYTGEPEAATLFRSEGFQELTDCVTWTGARLEGGELPELARPGDVQVLARLVESDPALAAYGGATADWSGPLRPDADLLGKLIDEGLVRVGPGRRSLALLRRNWLPEMAVTFLAGTGSSLEELLYRLRAEADAQAVAACSLLAPQDHPAADTFQAVGYDRAHDEKHALIYSRGL